MKNKLIFLSLIISVVVAFSFTVSAQASENRVSHFGVQGAIVQFPQEMKSAGIEITREWIEWNRIEPTNNNYDWTGMDTKVQSANNAGVEILGYFIGMPTWARDSSDPKCNVAGKKMGDICTPNDWADYEEFASKVAERYDGKHGHGEMKYIGVWNEVQLFSNMTAEEYAPWLTKGYSAIKQGNPDAQVTIGSFLDPFEFLYSGDFINTMFRDYSNYFDITDFHVYRKEAGVTETSRNIKERMSNYNINKTMWITETATNLPTLPCNLDWYDDIAIDVVKRYTRAFAEGVDKIFWFGFVAMPTKQEDASGIECGGLHNFNMGGLGWSVKGSAEFHPRPAYTAYKTMTSKLAGFSSVTKITDTQYKFIVNGRNVYVLWGSGNVPSEISGTVRVTDYLGNEQTKNASSINLTNEPIFIHSAYTFTRSLRLGMRREDVRQLQIFLNAQGFTVSTTGAGSPGNESTFFGLRTWSAVKRFQERYAADILTPSHLTHGTGFVGLATLAKLNELSQ